MIDPTLLDRLREADPETYIVFQSMPNKHLLVGTELQEAWLQHVLQEAIRRKGRGMWRATITAGCPRPTADLWTDRGKTFVAQDDTEAGAILRAYLAAIEAKA